MCKPGAFWIILEDLNLIKCLGVGLDGSDFVVTVPDIRGQKLPVADWTFCAL